MTIWKEAHTSGGSWKTSVGRSGLACNREAGWSGAEIQVWTE